jgi:hypothetical protein
LPKGKIVTDLSGVTAGYKVELDVLAFGKFPLIASF